MSGTARRLVLAAAAAGALTVSTAGLAGADPSTWVRFDAVGNDNCEVTFTIDNNTNIRTWTIDFLVDDEEATGDDFGGAYPSGRIDQYLNSKADAPTWPGAEMDLNRPLVTATYTVDVSTLANLPDPDSDTHTIRYRMVLGPSVVDPEWRTTEVSGCNPAVDPEPEPGTGSLGSLGPIFGILGGLLG